MSTSENFVVSEAHLAIEQVCGDTTRSLTNERLSKRVHLPSADQLACTQARKEKAERIKTLGDPLELQGKALAIEVHDGVAWIAENTHVVRKVDLEVRFSLWLLERRF